jgi:pantoate--beta-alanine ligase
MAEWSAKARREGFRVGFVPTMGALHQGHLALVHRALEENGRGVCSIFVNPLQFNDPADLEHYPRPLEQDRAKLAAAGCHALFLPSGDALFNDGPVREWDLGGLDARWEGPSRPGHFQGVVRVVERLFHYVRPDKAYFGEKDRQQLAIIRYVAQANHWPETIVPCPTVREPDGLAMSSRNIRLTPEQRSSALALHAALQAMQRAAFRVPVAEAEAIGRGIIGAERLLRLDYCSIVDRSNLLPIDRWPEHGEAIALVAAAAGPVRLIDNLTLTR